MNNSIKMFICYALCLIGFLGVAGLHHFYLGNYIRGFIYLFTFGLFYLGTVFDLFSIPVLVQKTHRLDVAILKICRSKYEASLSDLVIETNASPEEVKKTLDRLQKNHLITVDNS